MNLLSEDIRDMLIHDSSLGYVFNENLFIGRMPAKPAVATEIIDSYGYSTDLGLETKDYHRPSVQIIVRHKDYKEGMALAENIKDSLHGRNNEMWNGTLYTVIVCQGTPALLGWDENGLIRVSINFNAQRRAV